jgi:23S rRNA pseudouridine2457 synthase
VHPKKLEVINTKKEYYVQVDGLISQEAVEQLKNRSRDWFDGKKYITKKPGIAFLIDDPKFPLRSCEN